MQTSNSEKKHSGFLSKTEKTRFDALAKYGGDVKEASTELGISPKTLSNWLWALRLRYVNYRGRVNAILSQTRRHGLEDVLKRRVYVRASADNISQTDKSNEIGQDEELISETLDWTLIDK